MLVLLNNLLELTCSRPVLILNQIQLSRPRIQVTSQPQYLLRSLILPSLTHSQPRPQILRLIPQLLLLLLLHPHLRPHRLNLPSPIPQLLILPLLHHQPIINRRQIILKFLILIHRISHLILHFPLHVPSILMTARLVQHLLSVLMGQPLVVLRLYLSQPSLVLDRLLLLVDPPLQVLIGLSQLLQVSLQRVG